jgi:hypothetical protein
VIGAGGRLHGFAGSCDADSPELGIKYALLRMEGAIPASEHESRTAPEAIESLFAVTA